jgi:hypothetical protein
MNILSTIMIYDGSPDRNRRTQSRTEPTRPRRTPSPGRTLSPALILILSSLTPAFYCRPALLGQMLRQFAATPPACWRSLSPSLLPPLLRPPLVPRAPSDTAPAPPTGDKDGGGGSNEVGRLFSGSEPSSSSSSFSESERSSSSSSSGSEPPSSSSSYGSEGRGSG